MRREGATESFILRHQAGPRLVAREIARHGGTMISDGVLMRQYVTRRTRRHESWDVWVRVEAERDYAADTVGVNYVIMWWLKDRSQPPPENPWRNSAPQRVVCRTSVEALGAYARALDDVERDMSVTP
jgi:hypothetical protein